MRWPMLISGANISCAQRAVSRNRPQIPVLNNTIGSVSSKIFLIFVGVAVSQVSRRRRRRHRRRRLRMCSRTRLCVCCFLSSKSARTQKLCKQCTHAVGRSLSLSELLRPMSLSSLATTRQDNYAQVDSFRPAVSQLT